MQELDETSPAGPRSRSRGRVKDLQLESLTEYALAVLSAWIGSGVIYQHLRSQFGINLVSAPELKDDGAIAELAGLIIAVALRDLPDTLARWSPMRGSSLSSFFIGHCLLVFPNEYRRWLREQRAGGGEAEVLDAMPDYGELCADSDPAHVVAVRLEARQVMHLVKSRQVRCALLMQAVGFSQREIASALNMELKPLEMALYRARKNLRHSLSAEAGR
ncbi:hypothetical protein [Streptomyces sp. NPDC059003]|uniref:hypothetical protein n=1 Tax=Streptomyces sp. NPDC059003 TaxID=3346691 RepID=UPI0036BFAEE4